MCIIDSQRNIEKLKSKLGFGWYVYPIELDTPNKFTNANFPTNSDNLFCVHCNSTNISLIGYDNYNTVNGQSSEWVYHCEDCRKQMTIVKEFN